MKKWMILLILGVLVGVGVVMLRAAMQQRATAGAAAVVYACPMHPEVQQNGPGTCPKCGMALTRQ